MEEELKRLIVENKVIPFVGAGVSKAVKFKSGKDAFVNWKELLESFLDNIGKESKVNVIKALLEDEPINYLEIADKIEQSLSTNDFNKVLKQAFDIDYNEIDKNTYTLAKEIWNLNSNLIITTNYDKVLHNACDDENISFWDIESIHEQGNFLRDGISKPTVWNLHGYVDNTNNIILTTNKYNELYTEDIEQSKYSASLATLKTIISSNSLLFIGFSLDDEFVKEQITKTVNIFAGNSCEHYVLVKKGGSVDTINGNIKVIEYEDHGQPLIDKLKSLKPIITEKEQESKVITEKEDISRHLTTLPPKNENFIGRVEDLETIEIMLNAESITYIVNGIGGVGKSELSCEYFHRNKHKYKNVAFMEYSEDTTSIEELFYVKFKEQFNLNEDSSLDDIIKKLQNLPSKNLLLLDNLESKEDFEKIKALNTNFDLLITTRITDIDVKNQLPLDTLNDEDAKELFLSIHNKDKNIEDILEYLDNHPLFINLTARSLDKEYITLEELRAEIKNDNIYKIDSEDDKTFKEHLEDRFAKQFSKEENEELKELLQILSIFPSIEIDFAILEKSISTDKLKVKLQKLVERGWLSKKENSYKLHQIIKVFIQTDYPLEYKDITFIFDNIAKYIDPYDSTLIGNKLSEYIPILESFINIYKDKEDKCICGILDSITYLYYSLGQYAKAVSYQEESFEIREKTFGKESEFTAKSYNLLGVLYKGMGDSYRALELEKIALQVRIDYFADKHHDLSRSYNNLSMIYKDIKNIEKAFKYQKKALEIQEYIFQDIQHPDLASSYNNISLIYSDKNELSKAQEYQEKALIMRKDIFVDNNHPDIAQSYNNLSMIHRKKGELSKALKYQKTAIELTEINSIEAHPTLATYYSNLSLIYGEMKQCMNAKKHGNISIDILMQLDFYSPSLMAYKEHVKNIESNIKKQKKAKFKDKGRFCIDV